MAVQLKTNQTLTLKIKRLGINGEGIAYYKRLIIFVTGALPNETVVARISKATPRFAEADLVKIIKKVLIGLFRLVQSTKNAAAVNCSILLTTNN